MHRAVHIVIMAIVIMAVKQCFICASHKEPRVKKKKSPERLTKPLISVLSDIIDDLLRLLVSSVSHV